jgi:rfaE bifunctional protein nucleotidyltransferase chain/domain
VKRRLLAADQILIREDEGHPDDELNEETIRRLLSALDCATEELRTVTDGQPPTLVVCDYGLGALPSPVRAWLVAHRERFATVALDAHELADWRGLAPTVVTPSFAEATRLLDGPAAAPDEAATPDSPPSGHVSADQPGPAGDGILLVGDDSIVVGDSIVVTDRPDRAVLAQARLAELRERTGAEVVAVTLDSDGAVVAGSDGCPRRSRATPVPASHAVGAGDVYLAAMTLALTADAPLPTAVQLAQLAATVTVSDTGTCVCHRDELLGALGSAGGEDPSPTVVDAATLAALAERHRQAGQCIVFTNGCFDVLHRGHVRYLDEARGLGDLLVVAVNSDDSVRRLKGPDRPVNPVEDRVAVLAALSCVDYVVVFEEDSPSALIEAVRPDVYVKGGDYPPELVPEAPLVRSLGGQVQALGYVPDRSTSAIIDRIRNHPTERAASVREKAVAGTDRGATATDGSAVGADNDLSGSPS